MKLSLVMMVCLVLFAAGRALADAAPGFIRQSDPVCRVAKAAAGNTLLPFEPEPIGPFYANGEPEPPECATVVRFQRRGDTLVLRILCGEPDTAAMKPRATGAPLWQGDSVELFFTATAERRYPVLQVIINAQGGVELIRQLTPYGIWAEPLTERIDPKVVNVTTRIEKTVWRVDAELPLAACGISADSRLNITRSRSADGSSHAWVDLTGGRPHRLDRMGRMTEAPCPVAGPPRLKLPAKLAVGENALEFVWWDPRCKLTVGGKPVAVNAEGKATVSVTQYGPTEIELLAPDGTSLWRGMADVPRPMIVACAKPFDNDPAAPLAAKLTLNVGADKPVPVALKVTQDGTTIGEAALTLAAGAHDVSVPMAGAKPGEVRIEATAELPTGALSAAHWCVVGQSQDDYDKFRADIEKLPTRSMMRAAMIDAAGVYRLTQDGDGEIRRGGGRGGNYNFAFWNQGAVYVLALAYRADWPENVHRGDKRFLESAAQGLEAALDPKRWQEMLNFPPNRNLQAWLMSYELLKDDVPPAQAAYWKRGLERLVEAVVNCWVYPASFKGSFYSDDVGTGTNHYALHAANVYTAGRLFGREDWKMLGADMMRRLARHAKDGQFPERRDVPASRYTWLTMNALGQYYWQSGDESVKPVLLECVNYGCHSSLPDGAPTLLHDGRVNSNSVDHFGDFVLSLTDRGRALARARTLMYVNASSRPGRVPPERWFRVAENAVNFVPGEETPLGAEARFEFLDGRGVIARASGFVYGLSAISLPPITGLFRLDPQNAVEVHHADAGTILCGANSQRQPEAGSFMRVLADRTVFLPTEGSVQRLENGHAARLGFDTFESQVLCRVLSPKTCEVRAEVTAKTGNEPVVFSFFPGVNVNETVEVSQDGRTLSFRNVTIACSLPVAIERDFRIENPYNGKRGIPVKPVRAYVTLDVGRPLVMRIAVRQPAPAPD